jgi:hypothetical protein
MRRAFLAVVVGLTAIFWGAPSRAFVSPGYGRGRALRSGFVGRWRLLESSVAYEWQIEPSYVRIYAPNGSLATEGSWSELEMLGDHHHMKLHRQGPDDVEYEAFIDEQGELSLDVLPEHNIMRLTRLE